MAQPTFDGSPIFTSTVSGGGTVDEGVLWVAPYESIIQRLHFNGENGDRYIQHGYPDRQWTYTGLLSAPTLAGFKSLVNGIEAYIDDGQAGNSKTLVDSFGDIYPNSQVRHFAYLDPPHAFVVPGGGKGYCARVQVKGTISGMQQEN